MTIPGRYGEIHLNADWKLIAATILGPTKLRWLLEEGEMSWPDVLKHVANLLILQEVSPSDLRHVTIRGALHLLMDEDALYLTETENLNPELLRMYQGI